MLSLQKLYRMNAEGDGFLAKVTFEESQTYTELPHKRKQVWNDTNMNRLEGKIDMKMKDIGCDLVTNGDYSNINYQYTVTPTYIDYQKKTLLQWLDDTKYKIDEATEKNTLKLKALKEAKNAFDRNYVREHGEIPDESEEEEYKAYATAKKKAVAAQDKDLKYWKKCYNSALAMFFEKKSELDNKIEELKSLQKQWREANASRAPPPKKKKVNRAPPPPSPSSSSGSDGGEIRQSFDLEDRTHSTQASDMFPGWAPSAPAVQTLAPEQEVDEEEKRLPPKKRKAVPSYNYSESE